jgi:DNA repair exonuclease SbcCD nuclease subunit
VDTTHVAAPPAPAASTGTRPTRRVLHTSDVHVTDVEATHDSWGWVVDVALEERVDLVIVAGDLFDHARVSDETVAIVLEHMRRLPAPTVVLPGNHDHVGPGSLYDRVDLSAAGSHVTLLTDPAGTEVSFDDLGIAVWGRGMEAHTPDNQPLAGHYTDARDSWRIAVAHGHYFATEEDAHRSSPIREAEIAALECDYLALGHWHRCRDVSAGTVTAHYSGSPTEGSDRGVNIVRLDERRGVTVQRRTLAPPADGLPPQR